MERRGGLESFLGLFMEDLVSLKVTISVARFLLLFLLLLLLFLLFLLFLFFPSGRKEIW